MMVQLRDLASRVLCSIALLGALLSQQGIAHAQELELDWAFGLISTDNVVISNVEADADGNVWIGGYFEGTVDLDPGAGVATITEVDQPGLSNHRCFLAKYTSEGEYLLALQLDGTLGDLAITTNGHILSIGTFSDTVDLDPGSGVQESIATGSNSAYIRHLDASGDFQNGWTFGGDGSIYPQRIGLALDGSIHVLGDYDGQIDIDPGNGIVLLTASDPDEESFWVRFNADGALLHGFSLPGPLGLLDLAIRPNGNFILCGTYFDSMDLDPGVGSVIVNVIGGSDGFWAEYDGTGAYVFGASYDGGVNDLALTPDGFLLIAGRLPGSMDMDLGPDVAWIFSENNFDVYYATYDTNFELIQAQAFVSDQIYEQYDLVVDANGNACLVGRYSASVDFVPTGPGGDFVSNGSQDAFVACFDPLGLYRSGTSFGNTGNDAVRDATFDSTGDLLVCGYHSGIVDVDPTAATTELAGPGAFVIKYGTGTGTDVPAPLGTAPFHVLGGDDQIELTLHGYAEGQGTLIITDVSGKRIWQGATNGNYRQRIALPNGGPRGYLVSLCTSGSYFSRKVMVY